MCIEATRSHQDPGKGRAPWGQGMQPLSVSLYDLIAHFLLVLSNIPLSGYSTMCIRSPVRASWLLTFWNREPSTGSYSAYHHFTLFWVLLLLECH